MPKRQTTPNQFTLTFVAAVALTRGQAVMAGDNDGEVKLPTGAGVLPIGIVLKDAAAGAPVDIQMAPGFAIGIASAAITRDALVRISGTNGRVASITPGVTTQTFIVGRALEAASADGDEVSLQLFTNPFAATT